MTTGAQPGSEAAPFLASEPLLRLRDRREERRRARTPAPGRSDERHDGAAGIPAAAVDRLVALVPGRDGEAPDRPRPPRVARGAVGGTHLPSLGDLARAVADGGLQLDPEYVFGVQAGAGSATGAPRWRGRPAAEVHAAMRAIVDRGTVLVVRRVRDALGFTRDLADALARATEARTDVNAYVSARAGQGFSPHDDDHDVLVVQCTGRRRWTLLGGGRPSPLRRDVDPDFAAPPAGPEAAQVVLGAGDTLYIPRGVWHVVDDAHVVAGEPSLHLSFGVYRLTGLDVVEWLAARLVRDDLVRADLPHGPAGSGPRLAELARRVADVAAELAALPPARVMAELVGALPPLAGGGCGHAVDLFPAPGGAEFFAADRRWRVAGSHRDACARLLAGRAAPPGDDADGDGVRAVLPLLAAAGLVPAPGAPLVPDRANADPER